MEILKYIEAVAAHLSDFAIFALLAILITVHGKTLIERIFPGKGSKAESRVEQKTSKEWFDGLEGISSQLATIAGNHIEHVQMGVDDIKETQKETTRLLTQAVGILQEIKEYGVKVRRK
jgi:hypothetical protein